MHTLNDFAHPGLKVHARTPGVILLVGDLKKLLHLLRTAVERPHNPDALHESQNRDNPSLRSTES